MRKDNRTPEQLRPIKIHLDYISSAPASVLIEAGNTRVICTATVEDRVPPFRLGGDKGWLTAEYGMLPMATNSRSAREATKGKPSGRTHEIQRLIGRALRAIVNLKLLVGRTIWIDCDVIQADGGTRTAAITGSFVALASLIHRLQKAQELDKGALLDYVAAVSVGIVGEQALLDLDYKEDSTAQVDMNLVMTGGGRFVEIQGTAEAHPFSKEQLNQLINLGQKGIEALIAIQKEILGQHMSLSSIMPSAKSS
ncbi:MAG: ribonuclease PH [Acidobacteria bacterium]|nr:ribonuclease PH [Acidobacteriota bacterium]